MFVNGTYFLCNILFFEKYFLYICKRNVILLIDKDYE